MAIIGLTGYAQSGKDTVASILVSEYGFTRVAFADKIRELAYELNPIVEGYDYDDVFNPVYLREWVDEKGWDRAKVKEPELRRILQDLGVGARKVLGEDIWVISVLQELHDVDTDYVITDVRFKNEATMLKQMNGQLWRVERPGVKAINGHISEHDLEGYDVDQVLSNEGTMQDLELLVRQRMDDLIANKTN